MIPLHFMTSPNTVLVSIGLALTLLMLTPDANAQHGSNVARYDNYRLYRVHITTADQIAMFQELERVSDSCIFYGHARQIGQRITILVAAHKIADFTELLERFLVEHTILVRIINFYVEFRYTVFST